MAAQAQQFQQKAEYFVAQIDKELSKYPIFNKLEQTVPVPKAYAALGAFGLFTLLVFFNIFAGFLTNVVGFFLPAYFSLKALETPQPQDDVQWLTYWVVFGFFTFLESFSSVILYYVPWWYTIKTLAIIWLMLPQTQGAKTVYTKVLRPAFQTSRHTVNQAAAAPPSTAETH
ncbi:ER membrane protein DP1/Yop1 [Thecaphora frezii]